ncbi:MAG TPA: GTPase Era [Kiritimatiellia bacterium]|nr:GTPase Era [Kiritimatiellia bacterium]
MSDDVTHTLKSGMAALVGRANVGKSSLTNAILGEKLSIVSPVAQTTRSIIRGILTDTRGQLVLVDTPGLHKAPGDLGRVMNRVARSSIEGTDVIMLVLDASSPPFDEDEGWMRRLVRQETPVVIALNKMDLGGRHEAGYHALWQTVVGDADTAPVPIWCPISATTGVGVEALVDTLYAQLPAGPFLYPEDMLSDYPRKLNMADVIREKLFHELREELPHAIAVWVDKIEEADDAWTVRVVIYVNKHSQKGIVIGEKGRMLRKIRRSSEAELTELYEHKVKLDLWVKVEKNWSRNFWLLKQFGYVS